MSTHTWLMMLMAIAIIIICGAFVEVIVAFVRWLWRNNKHGND